MRRTEIMDFAEVSFLHKKETKDLLGTAAPRSNFSRAWFPPRQSTANISFQRLFFFFYLGQSLQRHHYHEFLNTLKQGRSAKTVAAPTVLVTTATARAFLNSI